MIDKKIAKEFYHLFWPIAVAMFITNVLSTIDAMMVTNYDQLALSAITIAMQVQFLFGPVYFAVMTGVNIYSVQYYARGDNSKLKNLGGIGLTLLFILAIINFGIMTFFDEQLVTVFTPIDSPLSDLALTYMFYIKFAILLQPIEMFFMYQYRAIKKPKIAMYVGSTQAVLNIIFNYFLIYGNGPFEPMGIAGAGVGTILARFTGVIIYLILSYRSNEVFVGTFKQMFHYPRSLFKEVFINMLPLVWVELGFGIGNVIFTKIYATTSILEFTAFNIAKSTSFMINALVIATANVAGIMIGSKLSTFTDIKDLEKTKRNIFYMIALNSGLVLLLSIIVLPYVSYLFGATQEQFELLRILIIINGLWMAIRTFSSSIIAILKSGNDNKFVVLVDAGSTFIFGIPITLIALILFDPSIIVLRALILFEVIPKVVLGTYRLRQKKWITKLK